MARKDRSGLVAAMESGDALAEAERRYEIIAQMLDPSRKLAESERPLTGTEVKALSLEADRLMDKILALRAEKAADRATDKAASASADADKLGKVVALDANRFRKSG